MKAELRSLEQKKRTPPPDINIYSQVQHIYIYIYCYYIWNKWELSILSFAAGLRKLSCWEQYLAKSTFLTWDSCTRWVRQTWQQSNEHTDAVQNMRIYFIAIISWKANRKMEFNFVIKTQIQLFDWMTRLCTGCWANEHVRVEKNTRTPTIRNGERVRGGESEKNKALYKEGIWESYYKCAKGAGCVTREKRRENGKRICA